MKLVHALWGASPQALLDQGLRAGLAEAGVERLQVNVDDEPVAAALRIPAGEPVAAVVSTWTDGPAELVTAALSAVAARVAGWRVAEHRRLDPPLAADGERADALANVALLRRPAELAYDEWLRRWLVDHTPVAIRTQATFGYVQNVVLEALTPDAPPVTGIVEELFPPAAVSDVHAFYGSGGDDAELERRLGALMASVSRMGADRDLDLVPTSRYTWAALTA